MVKMQNSDLEGHLKNNTTIVRFYVDSYDE